MFGHNFKYTFKVLMRNRMLLFWTFVFPLVLGTMFKLAFSNIENSEKLNVIPIAIVDNEVGVIHLPAYVLFQQLL